MIFASSSHTIQTKFNVREMAGDGQFWVRTENGWQQRIVSKASGEKQPLAKDGTIMLNGFPEWFSVAV